VPVEEVLAVDLVGEITHNAEERSPDALLFMISSYAKLSSWDSGIN
jgi:hypothetical protein